MFLWFLGASFALVWNIFRSPALDYRLVMVGAVLPLAEIPFGGPRLLHTLACAVGMLAAVMLATRDRRLVRRRWISLPIGVLMHLVLDGVWTNTAVFWWPFFGFGFPPGPLPELDRGLGWTVVLELAGAAALVWCWAAFGLADPTRRAAFRRTGHLDRELTSP
jgi:hypothetical protein